MELSDIWVLHAPALGVFIFNGIEADAKYAMEKIAAKENIQRHTVTRGTEVVNFPERYVWDVTRVNQALLACIRYPQMVIDFTVHGPADQNHPFYATEAYADMVEEDADTRI